MSIITEAFCGVYPEKELKYECSIKYSAKFKDYNANVKIRGNRLQFNLSKRWREVGGDITKGLLQELFVKLFKDRRKTMEMELYNSFIKRLHKFVPKENVDSYLMESFNRVNEGYFDGVIEMPNLVFGGHTTTKLGSYEFQNDTVTVSDALRDAPLHLVDYVMYHELLHKKMQFEAIGGRSFYHTNEFRKKEREYKDSSAVENELKSFISGKRRLFPGNRIGVARQKRRRGFFERIFEW